MKKVPVMSSMRLEKLPAASILIAAAAFAMPGAALADGGFNPTFKFFGQADVRLAATSGAVSSFDGGFGKLRFGENSAGETGYDLRLTEISGTLRSQVTSSLVAQVTAQIAPDERHALDVVEAFLRWRPVSTSRTRFSLKAGAVFPKVSFENIGRAWSNVYTLTNSAANTWIAEEFRPVGLEASLQYRADTFDLFGTVGAFYANDRSGVALAFRGFTLNARKVGLWGDIRIGDLPPGRVDEINQPFVEADDRPGFSLGLSLHHRMLGEFAFYAADNRADTTVVSSKGRLWRTRFVNGAYGRDFGDWRVGAQLMYGDTFTTPTDNDAIVVGTEFLSLSGLLARDVGKTLRLAFRPEYFKQKDISTAPPAPDLDESGYAFTFAATYRFSEHLHLIGEWVHTDAHRYTKGVATPNELDEDSVQLNIRVRF